MVLGTVTFSLDDFGTGYSSLTYLKRLPVTILKIDQSFVRDMLADPDDLAILHGVIGLAASFQRGVIAEGVETEVHGEMLLQLGCDVGQGYAIARPMAPEQLLLWQQQWKPCELWNRAKPVPHPLLPILFSFGWGSARARPGHAQPQQPSPVILVSPNAA